VPAKTVATNFMTGVLLTMQILAASREIAAPA
jgi:hypothetical protein